MFHAPVIKRAALAVSALALVACSGGAGGNGVMSADALADLDAGSLRDEPVMFSVTDADSEVILYGTFHLLPKEMEWQGEALEAAIARSDEAWFELPRGAQNDPNLQQVVMRNAMTQQSLFDRLSDDDAAKLRDIAAQVGMPPEAMAQFRPWFAAVTLTQLQAMQSGFDASSGVEAVLEPKVEGLARRHFETAEQQIEILAGMSEDDQLAMLSDTIQEFESGPDLLARMAQSWATGDVDMLEDEIVLDAKAQMPGMYDAMFTRRNAAWTDMLVAELEGSGTDFVAVGAGHLLGPDSVPVMLAKRGYDVKVLTAE